MTHGLIHHELDALQRRYAVHYDAGERSVILEDVALPQGYTPGVVPVTLKLPSTYPRAAPRAELPWEVRYMGRVPRHLLTSGQWLVRGQLGDPLIFFPEWEQGDSLRTVIDAVLDDLTVVSDPAKTEACDA